MLSLRLADRSGLVPWLGPEGADKVLILVAERDLYAAEFIDYLLRTEGFEVVVAFDTKEAIEVCVARHPDLVFVELVVSGFSGLDLCRQLNNLGATVVAVSALAVSSDAIDAGASAFLLKPLDPLQVLSTVKELLGLSVQTRHSLSAST